MNPGGRAHPHPQGIKGGMPGLGVGLAMAKEVVEVEVGTEQVLILKGKLAASAGGIEARVAGAPLPPRPRLATRAKAAEAAAPAAPRLPPLPVGLLGHLGWCLQGVSAFHSRRRHRTLSNVRPVSGTLRLAAGTGRQLAFGIGLRPFDRGRLSRLGMGSSCANSDSDHFGIPPRSSGPGRTGCWALANGCEQQLLRIARPRRCLSC